MSDAPAGAWPQWLAVPARRPALWLLLLCAVLWLPGVFALPPLDRDESRFAQASKQMVETGDLVDIRFSTGTRYNKPVGIYWLQAASTALLGPARHDRIWTYRVPSLIGGYLAVLLLYGLARAFAPAETALAAAALLAATVLVMAETQIATTDAVLLATTLGGQAVLFRLYLADRDRSRPPVGRGLVLAGWLAVALGVLVKGPVILGVLGATAAAVSLWDGKWRWLARSRPLLGLVVVALVVLPWLIAIALHTHGAFFKQSLGHDFGDKLVGGQESHGAPPGYYLVLATLTLWPAILLVWPGIRSAWVRRKEPPMRYLLAWAGANWLMFEAVPTKLPHYILPAYPALVLLGACWLGAGDRQPDGSWGRVAKAVSGVQFVAALLAFPLAAAVALGRFSDGPAWPIVACAGAGVAAGLAALAFLHQGARAKAFGAVLAASLLLLPYLTVGVAPRLTALWLSPRAAALVAKDRRAGDPPVVIAGYVEPSLIFLLGTDTRIATGADAAGIAARQGGLALVEDRERSAFLSGLAERDTEAFAVDALSGVNYSHGRPTHITLYRVAPAPLPAE